MKQLSLILMAMMLFGACTPNKNTFTGLPQFNKKKSKQKIHPSIAFSQAIKRYRKETGHFPFDMQAFEYHGEYTRYAMQSMRELGFTNLYVSYLYLDSLVVDFNHIPLTKLRVKNTDYSIDLAGQLIYTKRDSSFVEYRVFDKSKGGIGVAYKPDTTTTYRR